MQGKLVVFEGGEGGGKTTQIQALQQWLQTSDQVRSLQTQGLLNHIVVTREPGGTAIGQRIRQLLLTPSDTEELGDRAELLLYAADRAQHVATCLRPCLEQGDLVLCDRFTASTVAYQGYGRGASLDLIHQLNAIATDGLVSDLTLWLDVLPEVGLGRAQQRGDRDRMEAASLGFHQAVRQGFHELFHGNATVERIDASQDQTTVQQAIQQVMSLWLTRWYPIPSLP